MIRSGGENMRPWFQRLALLSFAVAMISPVFLTGCQNRETVYYNRWEQETHRQHVDLARRNAAEQREYQDWRRRQDERH
jgi:hypothetical protein